MARGEPLIRQWNLLRTLQAFHFGVCNDDLAKRLECSKRQVQRDLNILQQVGFPISYEQRDFGKRYWKLTQNFLQADKICLSVTELLSLFLGKQLLAPLAGTNLGDSFGTLLDKVKTLLPYTALNYFTRLDDTLVVKNTVLKDYSCHDKKIHVLNQAILEGKVVDLRYQSVSKGKVYETQYHPYGIIFFNTNLYCVGYMAEYGEIRTIKIDRIADVKLTNQEFDKPNTFSLQSYAHGSFGIISDGRPQKIKVRLTSWAAVIIREQKYHISQRILRDNGKQVTVQFELSDTTEFIRWILGFGKYAIVLQPKSVAESVAEELRAASKLYVAKKTTD